MPFGAMCASGDSSMQGMLPQVLASPVSLANVAEQMLKHGALKNAGSIKFFRGFKTVQDIREMVKEGFEKFVDTRHLDMSDGCSESCEPFLDGNNKKEEQNKIPTRNIQI